MEVSNQTLPDSGETNPELIELEDSLDSMEQLTFSSLPSFDELSELNGTMYKISNPQLVLTSKDIYHRILRDFKKTNRQRNTRQSSNTVSSITSTLVDNPLPDTIFKLSEDTDTEKEPDLPLSLIKLQQQLVSKIDVVTCPNDELHSFLFAMTVALYPELLSYQLSERLRCFKRIRSRMAFDLDDQGLFTKYGYRGSFRKTVAQDELLGDKPIYSHWFRKYLSDYFDVNVLVLCEELLISFAPIKYRTTLICYYQDGKLQLLSHNNGKCFFDYDVVTKIIGSGRTVLEHLHSASKYKLKELQQIAVALNLPITCKSKTNSVRNIVKNKLYQDISNKLCWLN